MTTPRAHAPRPASPLARALALAMALGVAPHLATPPALAANSGAATATATTTGSEHASECLEGRLDRSRLLGMLAEHAEELRYDEQSGRDTRNYPPDRQVDYISMDLDIDIPDMNTPAFTASQSFAFTVLGMPVSSITLNAMQMEINSVALTKFERDRTRESHSYDGQRLTVTFQPPLIPGRTYGLDIEYRVEDPVEGLFWITESPEWPDRPAQIHTQGQPETNRFWFPCHDFPNERMVTNLSVTVPEGYEVSTNGDLTDRRSPGDGRVRFAYALDGDHPAYLVTLIVGKFDIVDVAPEGGPVRMPVYVPPGRGHLAELTYGNTHPMLETFERRFDEPYPWGNRYAQLVVWNFGAGGMENTGATTMYDTAILDHIAMADRDLDGLIAHELAHQWFGDLITCNSWEHIWLNEGWATYSEALWFEDRDGYSEGYLGDLVSALRDLPRRDQMEPGSTHFRPAMVSKVYHHPWEVFRRTSNPYPKGAAILHMLRMKLGEDVFFDAVAEYVDRFKHRTVRTSDFRDVLEEVSGLSLEQFFEQWCHRPGTPRLHVSVEWDAPRGELVLIAEQRQRIDAEHPAFVFDLPIEIYAQGDGRTPIATIAMPIDAARHERRIPLTTEPASVIIDPEMSVAAHLTVDDTANRLMNQAFSQRSLPARITAIRALRDHAAPDTERVLARIILSGDASTPAHDAIEAAETLGHLGALRTLLDCLTPREDAVPLPEATTSGSHLHPRTRRAIIEAIGRAIPDHPDDEDARAAEPILAIHAGPMELSYATRAAAIEALARIADASHLPIIETALLTDSQHDQIRQAALRALRRMDLAQGLDLAAPYTEFGNLNRTRPVAIDTVAELAHHDRRRALRIIAPLLSDSEKRTVRAAVDAVAVIGHPDGDEALTRLQNQTRDPFLRESIEKARPRLTESIQRARAEDRSAGDSADNDTTRALREDLEALREQLRSLMESEEEATAPAP
ncbi:MAG: M1 family aminopeptidase [Phycisphaerales bacterium]